jgi:hypothetical protein
MECDKPVDGLFCDPCREIVLARIREKLTISGDDQAARGLERMKQAAEEEADIDEIGEPIMPVIPGSTPWERGEK